MTSENSLPALPIAEALQHPEQSGDYIQSQVDFLMGVNQLMSTLRTNREPDRAQHEFEFLIRGLVTLELPGSIRKYCRTGLEDATVTLTKEAGEEPLISLDLHFRREKDGERLTLHASRDPQIIDGTEDDVIFEHSSEEEVPVERLPQYDINSFLLGLALGDTVHHREALQNSAIYAGGSYDVLLDLLYRTADSWQSHVEYGFDDAQRMLTWTNQSTAAGESLVTCQFTYETGSDERSIVVSIDPSKGLNLQFKLQDQTGGTTNMSPDTGDIVRLQEIIDELTQRYDTTEVIPIAPADFSDDGVLSHKPRIVESNEDDKEY